MIIMKKLNLLLFTFLFISAASSQTDKELITDVLNKYIEGSTYAKPELLKEAFHPKLNLFYIKNQKITLWSGVNYIKSSAKEGPTGEVGEILMIDVSNDIATAKLKIINPKNEITYIDYFMLMREDNGWIITHKMFTRVN